MSVKILQNCGRMNENEKTGFKTWKDVNLEATNESNCLGLEAFFLQDLYEIQGKIKGSTPSNGRKKTKGAYSSRGDIVEENTLEILDNNNNDNNNIIMAIIVANIFTVSFACETKTEYCGMIPELDWKINPLIMKHLCECLVWYPSWRSGGVGRVIEWTSAEWPSSGQWTLMSWIQSRGREKEGGEEQEGRDGETDIPPAPAIRPNCAERFVYVCTLQGVKIGLLGLWSPVCNMKVREIKES